MSGFSLIELMLVMTMFGVVTAFMFPMSISLYQSQVLTEVESGMRTTLQTAHTRAVSQKSDSAHGVKVLENSYVLFEGYSYDTRENENDTSVQIPNSFIHSGFDEIVFAQYTGVPSATGTLSLEYAHDTSAVIVYESGVVN